MLLLTGITFLAVALLSFANGANDNFKGVATLLGSRTASYRGALWWATATTLAGSLVAAVAAQGLLQNFSGKGLVEQSIVSNPLFSTSVALAAGLTVILATRWGFPVSTTHALVGALCGAGLVASQSGIDASQLVKIFFLPLILSPLLSLVLTVITYRLLWRRSVFSDTRSPKQERLVKASHFITAGMVSFSRGLNDAPKIAAICLSMGLLNATGSIVLVTVIMAMGGLMYSKRISQTLSFEITTMDGPQGLCSSLVTSIVVLGASQLGVPVSTTHVSCGSIFGIGLVTRNGKTAVMSKILLSWITTLPCALVLGALSFTLLTRLL